MKNVLKRNNLFWFFSMCFVPLINSFAQSYAAVYPSELGAKSHYSEAVIQKKQLLADALQQVQTEYEVHFAFNDDIIRNKVVAKKMRYGNDINTVLEELLQPLGLSYELLQNGYYVIFAQGYVPDTDITGLDTLKIDKRIIAAETISQNRSVGTGTPKEAVQQAVTGTITSAEDNMPLPGASVVVKGTTTGVSSDFDGLYSIEAPETGSVLVFSYIGFAEKEITYTGQNEIDVALEASLNTLDEVVVVGYGTQKRSDLTGSVSTVTSEEVTQTSDRNLESALQGRAAGVNVARSSGEPGSSPKVSIRGVGTFNDNGPLYVIDGVPQDPGVNFNPQDVESIEVLKDASAAAIYGARAAHGVILITTKRGKEGKINVNINSSTGFRNALNVPDYLGTSDYIALATEARENSGIDPEPSWSNPGALPNTDWGDAVFGTALEQSHNFSVSGGSKNANFFVSGAYDNEDGTYIDTDFERYSFRANSDFTLGILTLGESFIFTRTGNNSTADGNRDLFYVTRAVPTFSIFDPNNPVGGYGQVPSYNNGTNPVGIQEVSNGYNLSRTVNGNIYAQLEPVDGLKLRGSLGYVYNSGLFRDFTEEYDFGSSVNSDATLRYLSTDNESFNLNLVLSYEKSFGGHNVSALVGAERFTRDGLRFDAQFSGFPVDVAESFGLSDGDFNVPERNTIPSRYRLNSLFGRIGYDYEGKYLLQGNIRRDGSSRFGANNKYGVFPSASAGWRVSEEDFMQGVDWLSNLKLRASYGILGSDRIGDFNDATYSSNRSIYIFNPTGIDGGSDQIGFFLSDFTNEDRKWEEVEQLDIGLDLGLFNNSLNVNLDYYNKTTTDLLVPVQLPLSFGVSGENSGPGSVPVNVGSLENEGVELSLNYTKKLGDWNVKFNANGAYNRNEVLELADDNPIDRSPGGPNNPRVEGNISRTEMGRPLGAFYGLIVDGVIQTQAELDALNSGAEGGVYQENGTAPGDFRYRDINGDGQITNEDRDFLGNPFPKFTYGFNASVEYKGIDFSVFFQGIQDVDIFNLNRAIFNTFYSDFNSTTKAFERWTPENPINSAPRLTTNDPNGNFSTPSSYFVEDGSYLKLRNIQLGYSLPKSILSKIGMKNLRFYVNAQNIWTITGYSGIDPEISNGQGGNTLQGVEGLARYPQTYLISSGVQIGF